MIGAETCQLAPGSTMPDDKIDIDALIDSSPISALQWRVVVLCFVLAVVDGFDAQSIAYTAPVLAEQFALTKDVTGQLISSALVGLMIGALVGSPLADRLGRKPVIIVSVAIMGVFSLATMIAGSTTELFVYRFLTGLGLGGVMPNINTLTAEFAPARRRAFLMTAMFVGFPVGTIVGGFAAAGLISRFGWEAVFFLGGVAPLSMVPLLFVVLPESPRFLAMHGSRSADLARIVAKLAPGSSLLSGGLVPAGVPQASGSIRSLFASGRTPVTLLLWLVCFANLLTLYAILGWLPSVLNAAGFPLERAILSAVVFSLGAVIGGLVIAAAIDRYGAISSMVASFLCAALAVALIGQLTGWLVALFAAIFLAGATVSGNRFSIRTPRCLRTPPR